MRTERTRAPRFHFGRRPIIGFSHDDAERNVVAADLAEYLISHADENEWAAREGLRPSDREQA